MAEVGVDGFAGSGGEGDPGAAAAFAHDGQRAVPPVVAEVGDVGGGGFVDPQAVVDQQPDHGGVADSLGCVGGVGGGDQRPGLGPVQADGGGVVGVDDRAADSVGGDVASRPWAAACR